MENLAAQNVDIAPRQRRWVQTVGAFIVAGLVGTGLYVLPEVIPHGSAEESELIFQIDCPTGYDSMLGSSEVTTPSETVIENNVSEPLDGDSMSFTCYQDGNTVAPTKVKFIGFAPPISENNQHNIQQLPYDRTQIDQAHLRGITQTVEGDAVYVVVT